MLKNILLAEDDPNDVLLFEWAVKRTGLEPAVHVAENGQDVMDYLARCAEGLTGEDYPDLVLLDLKMPRVNGFEVLQWLADQPSLPPVPVVVLSGSSIPADMHRARELGAQGYLEKPINPVILRELLFQPAPARAGI
jgi:CheY-like chemotaxis protein